MRKRYLKTFISTPKYVYRNLGLLSFFPLKQYAFPEGLAICPTNINIALNIEGKAYVRNMKPLLAFKKSDRMLLLSVGTLQRTYASEVEGLNKSKHHMLQIKFCQCFFFLVKNSTDIRTSLCFIWNVMVSFSRQRRLRMPGGGKAADRRREWARAHLRRAEPLQSHCHERRKNEKILRTSSVPRDNV